MAYPPGAVGLVPFVLNLALAVLFLALAIHSGWTRRRRRHYRMVAATVVLLVLAIVQAELFGQDFHFDPLRLRVHLWLAGSALLALPGVAWTGTRLAQDRGPRRHHRLWVGVFVGLVLAAVLSAGWMFGNAAAAVS